MRTFGWDWCWLPTFDVLNVKANSFSGLVAREDKSVAVWKPVRPVMIDGVIGKRARFAGLSWQKAELRGRTWWLRDDPLTVRRKRDGRTFAKENGRRPIAIA